MKAFTRNKDNPNEEKTGGFAGKVKDNLMNPKNGVRILSPEQLNVTEEIVYVHPKMEEDLYGVASAITDTGDLGEMNYSGIMFTGYPGTGKTLTSKFLCKQTDSYMIDLSGQLDSKIITSSFDTARRIRDSKGKPVLIFVDEIERISSRDDIVDPNQGATLSQLLMEMDGTENNQGITVIAATNRPDKLDSALRRGGRFDEEVEFLPPDQKGRFSILKMHAYNKEHKFKIQESDLEDAAKVTYGYVGADLKALLTKSMVRAKTKDRLELKYEDFEYAMKKIKPSAIRDMPFEEPDKGFEELKGYTDHFELLQRIFSTSSAARIMSYGPAGTGKTESAKACAKEFGANLIVISGSEPEDKFVGETGKKLDRYFDRARALSPTVLVFDQLDALVETKGVKSHKGTWTGLLESKLSKDIPGVYIIATMNRPDQLRKSMRDRFPDKLYFGMPSTEDQKEIWKHYIPQEIDADKLIAINENVSCRDITEINGVMDRYGLPANQQVYENLVAKVTPDENLEIYETHIKPLVGDSVEEFQMVKDCISELGLNEKKEE